MHENPISIAIIPFLVLLLLLLVPARAINVTTGGKGFSVLNSSLYVVLGNHSTSAGQRFGVVAWQRVDTPAPHATVVAAAAVDIPASLLNCSVLTLDIPLLRTLGSSYRAPLSGTIWLFADDPLAVGANRPFNATRALATRRFAPEPTEGNWTVLGATGGVTVDEGAPAKRFHVETYRFRLANVSLLGARRYWVALAVELERAFNTSDFSMNQPRWLLADGGLVSVAAPAAQLPFRVVDRYGSMFRAMPALANWTNGTNVTALAAAGVIVPTGVSANVSAQLALVAYASGCMNVTAVKTLAALDPQATTYRVLAPTPSFLAPSGNTSGNGTASPTPSPNTPTGIDNSTGNPSPGFRPVPSPLLPSPALGSPTGALPAPPTPDRSPSGPTPSPVLSPSPSPIPLASPSLSSGGTSPSPSGILPLDTTPTHGASPSSGLPSPAAPGSPTPSAPANNLTADTPSVAREWWMTPAATWGFVLLGGVCCLVLVLVALYVAARRFHPNVTDLSYAQLLKQDTGAAAAGGGGEGGGDADMIPLDDMGAVAGGAASVTLDALAEERRRKLDEGIRLKRRDTADASSSGDGKFKDAAEEDDAEADERKEARKQFDLATMREIPLNGK